MKHIAVDTEATGLFPYLGDRPFAISSCNENGDQNFTRGDVNPMTRGLARWPYGLDNWRTIIGSPMVGKVFHNAMYDIRMLETVGVYTDGRIDDTMIMLAVLFSNEERVSLKYIGEKYLDIPRDDEKELREATIHARREAKARGWSIASDDGRHGEDPIAADYWLAPPRILERYARLDAERTMLLFQFCNELLDEDKRLRETYEREMRLFHAVYRMVSRGVHCQRRTCLFLKRQNEILRSSIYSKLRRELGYDINLQSHKQVSKLLYQDLKLPVTRYTDKGAPSTDGKALEGIDHPVVKSIRKYNSAGKANSTFFDKYLTHMVKEDGSWILHPEFWQVGARTGRFSCRNPNLQQVANKDSSGHTDASGIQARTPFGPRPGCIWYMPDWSNMELWIFAAESGDENLLHDLRTGDVHTATANRVFGNGRDIVADEKAMGKKNTRSRAKLLNFGIVYGMGVNSTTELVKCSRSEARDLLDLYYATYTRIRPYMKEVTDLAERQGYVFNRFGRKLMIDRGFGYKAVNYIVQSSSADQVKNSMIRLDKYLINADLILTVHDELCIELPIGSDPDFRVARTVKKIMEDHQGIWPEIPKLPVSMKIVRERWDKPEEIEL